MDFLTTNFADDATEQFTAPFALLDLPLELLFKVMVFLDEPEMRALARTCHYLRSVARERFIMRSKFFYVRDKIGIRLTELRPALSDLYQQHIVPVQSVSMLGNSAHLLVVSDLQRSFRRSSLSKELKNRPDLSELHQKNIIPIDSSKSPLVKSRVKDIKRENLSQMLQLLMRSYRFQKKILRADVETSLKIADKKMNSTPSSSSTPSSNSMSKTEHRALISKIDLIDKRARSNGSEDPYLDIPEEFARIYNRLCSRFGHSLLRPNTRSTPSSGSIRPSTAPEATSTTTTTTTTEFKVLNHVESKSNAGSSKAKRSISSGEIPLTPVRLRNGSPHHSPDSSSGPQSRISSTSSCFSNGSPESPIEGIAIETSRNNHTPLSPIPTVRSRKQYFEQLSRESLAMAMDTSSSSSASQRGAPDGFLRPVGRKSSSADSTQLSGGPNLKPSRTVLKASVINDSMISYEKLF